MDDSAADCDAIFESTVFLSYFNDLPDPRQAVKVVYPLDEVLLLTLLAVLAGAGAFTDIARFGEKKLTLLRRFRPFLSGTPPHDRIGDIFAALDAAQLQLFCRLDRFADRRAPGWWRLTGRPPAGPVARAPSIWCLLSPSASAV